MVSYGILMHSLEHWVEVEDASDSDADSTDSEAAAAAPAADCVSDAVKIPTSYGAIVCSLIDRESNWCRIDPACDSLFVRSSRCLAFTVWRRKSRQTSK